jgi:hypothetical protein
MKRFMRTPAAGAYLQGEYGIGAARTLGKYRCIGGGPPYRRLGRIVVYNQEDLDAWAQAKLGPLQRSTSDTSQRVASPAPAALEVPPRRMENDASEANAKS